MSFTITTRAERELAKLKIEPQLVLEIEGVTTLFGAVEILRLIRIGDDELEIGDDWKIGGLSAVVDQEDVISFDGGSSTRIDQQLQPDKGSVSSVSSVSIALTDRQLVATRLISPGVVIDDILGVKAKLWMGFRNTAFKEDYIQIFAGIIDDVESGAGIVKLNLAHPEQLKRQEIYNPVDAILDATMNDSQTTIELDDASNFPVPVLGPDGSVDETIKFYVKIEDEYIRYEGRTGNTLTGCTRASLASLNVAHTVGADDITVKSLVALDGTAIDIALKVMLSGTNGNYLDDLAITRYLHPDPLTTIPNSIFFQGVDLNRDYGVVEGDYITITDATEGANNCSAKTIQEIISTDDGSYAVINDVTFVEESDTEAVISFRSQFDSLGYGLAMSPDQVDINEHIYWQNFLLASYSYLFVLQEKINGKDFLDKEVYLPIGAYSLPRQGRCSMGYHIGPVFRGSLKTLNRDNIKDPDKIRLRRTINRNFYNTIVYRFDKPAASDKFTGGYIAVSADSINRIAVGNKVLAIASEGLRRSGSGAAVAQQVSTRYLARYQFATEFFESIGLLFRDGYALEPGDSVLLDPTRLKISNTEEGTRNKLPKVFEVTNKSIDLKTGDVKVSLTDTNFDHTERYGTVSPSSTLIAGSTTTELMIDDSFGAVFPEREYRKWEDYLGLPIIVHSEDWSFEEEVTLESIDPANRKKLILASTTPLSAPPPAGYVIEVGNYPDTEISSDNGAYKAVHAFLSMTAPVTASALPTSFEVDPGDIPYFNVGTKVRIHNADFSDDSGEVKVVSISSPTVTVEDMGFTPDTSHVVENLDFLDGGKTYRII